MTVEPSVASAEAHATNIAAANLLMQDDPTYAEHWAGHRPVTVTIEPDRIVISRAGEDAGENGDEEES